MIVKRKNKDYSFCFIIFDEEASAKAAIKQRWYDVGGQTVECSVAEPKIRTYLNKVMPDKDGANSTILESRRLFDGHSSKNHSKDHSNAPSKKNSKDGRESYVEESVSNLIKSGVAHPSKYAGQQTKTM